MCARLLPPCGRCGVPIFSVAHTGMLAEGPGFEPGSLVSETSVLTKKTNPHQKSSSAGSHTPLLAPGCEFNHLVEDSNQSSRAQ